MAQSAVLGFGVSSQIKGLGGGVDRKWVAVGGVKKEHFGQRKGVHVPVHSEHLRGPPALRCSNQRPLQGWPRVQEPPEEEKEQGDAQPTYKAPFANPPQGYFPIQTGGGYPYPYPYPYPPYNQGGYPNYPPYPYSPHQQFYPNVGYSSQYPPQQPYPNTNVGYPPQQPYHYPPQQQPYPPPQQYNYPPQQYNHPPQQPNPAPAGQSKLMPTIAVVASILASAQQILNGSFPEL